MRRSDAGLLCALLCLGTWANGQTLHDASKPIKLMGCRFEISAVAEEEAQAWQAVEAGIAEIQRIEALISSWDPQSQTSAINRAAGEAPVRVDKELYDLIYRSLKISKLTRGAFDISFAAMDRIWRFDGSMTAMPDSASVAAAAQYIGYQGIELDAAAHSVMLRKKGMKIGFGAIGKGYAANRAKAIMAAMPGVRGGVVDASGDLLMWGDSPKGRDWRIGISDPNDKARIVGWLDVSDVAVVTSGDYEKYVMFGGRRYAHIIDPRTGYPATGVKSVTIVCPDAELADALATAVFVLGVEDGLALINALNGVEGLIIDDQDRMHPSEKLRIEAQ